MKSRVYVLFVAFWMCCAVQLNAQPDVIESRHYYMKDGLSDESITSLVQDKLGFLWIGTHSGLNKFDGYTFTSYQNDPTSVNSLGNNSINTMWQDKLGRLWLGHNEGLDVFDPLKETFFFHWYDSAKHNGVMDITVLKIVEQKQGNLWICTNQGIYIADPQTLIIKKYARLPGDLVYRNISEAPDGSVWASSDKGLIHYDKATNQDILYVSDPKDPKSLSNNLVRAVFFDRQDRMWVATGRGFNLFEPKEKSFTTYLPQLDVRNFFEISDSTMWIATEYGVCEFNRLTGRTKRFTGSYYTWSIEQDKQGNYWLPTLHGLHQLNGRIKKFKTYLQFDNNIGYIVEDENQQIWMSTFKGVFRFDRSFQNVYQHVKVGAGLSNLVGSIFSDRKGNIWFGSKNKIEKYNLKSGRSDSIMTNEAGNHIALLVDSRENIWLGNYIDVRKYDAQKKTWGPVAGCPKTAAHYFLEDIHQNIWMATSMGLIRYNLKNEKLDVFKNDVNDPQSLSNNTVYHILLDENNHMWVATDGGLNKVIPGTENAIPRFRYWRTANSDLPNNNVYYILSGGDGTIWMACGNMISHFFPQQNIFRNYVNREGLLGNFAQQKNLRKYPNNEGLPGRDIKEGLFHGRGLRSSDGQIYFGSGQGLIVFHPDSLQDNTFVPPVVITNFAIHNKQAPVKGTDADTINWESPLSQMISHSKEIKLSYDQNDFHFEFAALNYVEPENNLYKYRLEPYEAGWIETTANNRVARYTNIDPGTYTFRVIGSNNDGLWNEQGATLLITITPPWWQTWWAYSLYSLAFIGMFLYWRSYENKRLNLKHRAEHLGELDNLKSHFFANISHEFRTPITLILGPLKEMYNRASSEEQKNVVGVMMRNGQRLLRLINQLLDLSKIEAGKMKLQTIPVDLVQFLKEIASFYESLATDKKIKFFCYAEVQELPVYIDQEKMEKVIHNLLSNAFKFTKEGGEIILNLKAEKKQCLVIVRDTGIGIPPDQLNKVFDRFYQVDNSQTRVYEGSGLGMALAKELVELHHGTISVESIEGKGSIFTVQLRLGKEHLSKDEITDATELKTHTVSDVIISENSRIEISVEKETVSTESQPVLLIVEDNMDMRHFIRKILSDQYQIIEAVNGKSGVKMAEESVPDLIISDIMMPEMDGYKLCELIKTNELTSHIPVILLTAKADRDSKLSGLEIGADDYLSKPFDADELKLIVRNHIEERRRMRERFGREITLEPKQISIASLDEKFLTKVLATIEAHIDDENFSIDALSREAGYSNMHFYRKIKALSGQTPSQFLRTIRLKRAAELLSKNSDNVTQIAYSVGFSSLSYFNKCFKEQFGMTPGQFAETNESGVKES